MSNFLWVLFHPSYWLVTGDGGYSEQLDASLNKLLDESAKFDVKDAYHAQLGSYELWYRNHPYASFSTRLEHTFSSGKVTRFTSYPSRRTKARLMAALLKQEPILKNLD